MTGSNPQPPPSRARVLLAPDSFKGTFAADEVAMALARGVASAAGEPDVLPLGDGGEGTARALVAALGGDWHEATVAGPLGEPVAARFAALPGGRAALDAAAAAGLALVDPAPGTAWEASTGGVGELILAAIAVGAREVLVGVGGTASTDGGTGATAAIAAAGGLRGSRLVCLCDVATPWERAAATFAPQKGADVPTVQRLAARLDELAGELPRDPRGVPLTGAGGGLSGGLWAAAGAELVPGAAYACDLAGLEGRLAGAALVITGEGRLDRTSLEGKLVGVLAHRAATARVPCHAVVGSIEPGFEGRDLGLASVTQATTLDAIEAGAREITERIAREPDL